jgi:antitoxin (DNA-binding transcriptional repressor) of toxin-antitoxin stability system
MATRKEVSDMLARMAPGEDILVIKRGPAEFDIVKLTWHDVPAVAATKLEASK